MDVQVARLSADGRLVKRAVGHKQAARITAEAEVLARCQIPGVVELVGVDGDAGRPGLVTRRVEGCDLGRMHHLGVEELAGLVAAVATTLADLHDLGVVHGAVMASHVLVGLDGRPVLCGFGYGGRVGEPPADDAPLPEDHTDPARRPGGPLTPASDVYALGSLLRALTTEAPVTRAGRGTIPARWTTGAGRRTPRARSSGTRRGRRPTDRAARCALAAVADRATTADPRLRLSARSLAAAVHLAVPAARLPRHVDGLAASIAHPPSITAPPHVPAPPTHTATAATPAPNAAPFPPARTERGPMPPAPGQPAAGQPAPGQPAPAQPAPGVRPAVTAFAEGPVPPASPPPDGQARPALRRPAGVGAERPGRHRRDRHVLAAAAAVAAVTAVVVVVTRQLVTGSAAKSSRRRPASVAEPSAAASSPPPAPAPGAGEPTTTLAAPLRPGGPAEAPAGRGCPPVTAALAADTDDDGCPEALQWTNGVVETGDRRWRVGEPGDRVATADWTCSGRATLALLRPATGEVFVFDGWAEAGHDLIAREAGRVEGGFAIRAAELGDGCPRVAVDRPDATPVTLPRPG